MPYASLVRETLLSTDDKYPGTDGEFPLPRYNLSVIFPSVVRDLDPGATTVETYPASVDVVVDGGEKSILRLGKNNLADLGFVPGVVHPIYVNTHGPEGTYDGTVVILRVEVQEFQNDAYASYAQLEIGALWTEFIEDERLDNHLTLPDQDKVRIERQKDGATHRKCLDSVDEANTEVRYHQTGE